MWEKALFHSTRTLRLYHTMPTFSYPGKDAFGKLLNIVGKSENAVNQHFLLFQKFFFSTIKVINPSLNQGHNPSDSH